MDCWQAGVSQQSLVILYSSMRHMVKYTFATNYADLLTLTGCDRNGIKVADTPGAGPMTFSLRMGTVNVAGNDYFAIYETWTGVG